jgi:transcription-repair coupling factor (superfamily II helicase)
VRSVVQLVVPKKLLAARTVLLKRGDSLPMSQLNGRLSRLGYERTTMVDRPGEMSTRGGIFDIYPISSEMPYRLEFFGEEIDSIRTFDPATQRSVERVEEVRVLPRSEKELNDALLREERLTDAITDYLPVDTLVVVDEPVLVATEAQEVDRDFARDPGTLSWSGLTERLAGFRQLIVGQLAQGEPRGERIFTETRSMAGWEGNLELFWEQLRQWWDEEYEVVFVCNNDGERRRLTELLGDKGYEVDVPDSRLRTTIGRLRGGFSVPDQRLAILSGKELFGRHYWRRPRRRFSSGAPIYALEDLRKGDYVVHVEHGIGKYLGLTRLEDKKGDFLTVGYQKGDKLYVPITQISLVQKHVGADSAPPPLDKIGGTAWGKTKEKVSRAVRDMTADLLELYAARQTLEGSRFPEDTVWQKEFEDEFPYQETPDQEKAILDVKNDMEQARPMDRLICGDVGYGKTEVAMRAAFKVAMNGKQAVVLAPTTILAQQHYSTFRERFADYPVIIEMLSRFRSRAEQRQILSRLEEGTVDIVIGTHRLLSKDVRFRDLGLVVIDEEQRFGVAHKERLKQLRKLVDVITLSATPIPRTLHLSLMGVRDMSVINTAPEDRIPIHTIVIGYDENVIREAIMRELARDGQVFFVHNRIDTIYSVAARLQKLVPKARLAVAHGRMLERDLERAMVDFVNRRIDVLVSTTIIESGLDIPNVNTILINRADCFGLADLYQLRGRVGRYKHRAYAYLLVPGERALTEIARKRLKTLQDFSDLGSGYKIALRDLEIRGTGNILGVEQHGHIAAVGFELYSELVEEAAREFRGEKVKRRILPVVDLGMDAYLPDEYVPSPAQKIVFYKRVSGVQSEKHLGEIGEELADRFGPLPEQARTLLAMMSLRLMGADTGVELVSRVRNKLLVRFRQDIEPDQGILRRLLNRYGERAELELEGGLRFTVKLTDNRDEGILSTARDVLEEIAAAS